MTADGRRYPPIISVHQRSSVVPACSTQSSVLTLRRSRCMAKGAAVLIELLAEAGVRHVFGIPSGPWCPFMEAMRTGEVEFVLVSNEASAGFMADVCGRITGKPGA